MTFDEEWRFVDAYSFFCGKPERANEVQRLLEEAELRLVQTEQMQAYWDGEPDGRCYIILPEAVERFMAKNPKAVRIIPDDELPSRFDEKRLAAAMEWTLDFERKDRAGPHGKASRKILPAPPAFWIEQNIWIEWKTLTGKRLVKRFEIAD